MLTLLFPNTRLQLSVFRALGVGLTKLHSLIVFEFGSETFRWFCFVKLALSREGFSPLAWQFLVFLALFFVIRKSDHGKLRSLRFAL